MDQGTPLDRRSTRRGSLVRLGGLLTALAAGGAAAGEAEGGPAGVASGVVRCVLAPEQTEGPFYVPREKVRRDIRERRPGTPLILHATILDASACTPIRGAAVDVWHCDAGGVYSSFGAGSAKNFLRGVQRTNAKGLATFVTIYPGWYPGRAVHIHVKVHVGGNVVHTGQLYFPDKVTDAVYRRLPYSRRPARDTRNADDRVFFQGGRQSLVKVSRTKQGRYVAAITMGVQRG
jgi:protocatechuate 3,4-dioxygenase beta subunit